MGTNFKAAIIGAGFIANEHAGCIQLLQNVSVAAVIDPVRSRAERLARTFGCAAFADLGECDVDLDCAHILSPPPWHRTLAEQALGHGLHVLAEKPMAESSADCDAMMSAARQAGRTLKVNQNFVHHPAYAALRDAVKADKIGPPIHVSCVMSMPLRQLAAGQLGHWMFQSPVNLLLEQAVHPLSQITDLLGTMEIIEANEGPRQHGPDWAGLTTSWIVTAKSGTASITLQIALGEANPVWQLEIIGTDGIARADMVGNNTQIKRQGRWLEPVNHALMDIGDGGKNILAGIRNIGAYALSQLGVKRRNDAFFVSMLGSIRHFYEQLAVQPSTIDAKAAQLVELCETIANRSAGSDPKKTPAGNSAKVTKPEKADIAVIGGTGFIGRKLVARLVDDDRKVIVMARGIAGLPPISPIQTCN